MQPYLGILRTRFRALLQYRTAAIAGICTQVLFGLVRVMALQAYFAFGVAEQPMSLAQSVTYTWIGQAMLGMLPWNTEGEIAQSVRTGQVAYELARPLDLYGMWYARCLALRTAPTILRAVPQFLLATFVLPVAYRMTLPGIEVFGGWLLATLGALLLSCAVTNIINVSLFWTVSGEGLSRLIPTVVTLMSGMTVPLPLLPDWLQGVLRFQPFAGLVDGPARIFCGNLALAELPLLLATQLFWTAVFVLFGRYLLRRGLGRVSVAGG